MDVELALVSESPDEMGNEDVFYERNTNSRAATGTGKPFIGGELD